MIFPVRWWRQREGNCSVLSSGNDEIYERCPSSFSCASVPQAVTSGHCLILAGTWNQPGQSPMYRQHKWKVKITICILVFAILFDCVDHLFLVSAMTCTFARDGWIDDAVIRTKIPVGTTWLAKCCRAPVQTNFGRYHYIYILYLCQLIPITIFECTLNLDPRPPKTCVPSICVCVRRDV